MKFYRPEHNAKFVALFLQSKNRLLKAQKSKNNLRRKKQAFKGDYDCVWINDLNGDIMAGPDTILATEIYKNIWAFNTAPNTRSKYHLYTRRKIYNLPSFAKYKNNNKLPEFDANYLLGNETIAQNKNPLRRVLYCAEQEIIELLSRKDEIIKRIKILQKEKSKILRIRRAAEYTATLCQKLLKAKTIKEKKSILSRFNLPKK